MPERKSGRQIMDAQEEMIRLLAIQVRRLGSQRETIAELSKASFSNSRIAQLLGTTEHTVTVSLAADRAKAKAPRSQDGNKRSSS